MSERAGQQDRARREAAAWFARLSRPSVTTQSLREFRDWRGRPHNARAYGEIERTWTAAGELSDDPDILEATARALAPRRRPSRRLRTLAWAAPLATAAVAAALLLKPVLLPPAYETRTGEQRLVVLDDGSRVRLNTDTRLTVRLGPQRRRIALARGQAFFEVAHDPDRPFTVDAGAAEVTALGTRFDVRRRDAAVDVTLVEGRVEVRQEQSPRRWTLAPSQQLTVSPRAPAARPAPADAARLTSWTTGRLVFQGQPLAEAVAEVNRYAPHKVLLDPSLAGRPISGVFEAGDTQAFVAAVTEYFHLKAVPGPDGSVRLEPSPA